MAHKLIRMQRVSEPPQSRGRPVMVAVAVPIAIPVTAVLLPELFPRTIEWVLFWSSILMASATLLVSGVPAALYERLVERDPESATPAFIWLACAAALCIPTVARVL